MDKNTYRDYFHCIANFCANFLNEYSKEFLTTLGVKNKFVSLYETLEKKQAQFL